MKHIKKFQIKNGLDADGILGRITASKMRECWGMSEENLAHFLGQGAHESVNFTVDTENLNYSSIGLLSTFRKYFTIQESYEYQFQPERIANRVYANRMGNRSEETGDGWKYRGRGMIQLTGFNNQERFGQKIRDMSILRNPELIASKYFWDSGLVYFNENGLWRHCSEVNQETTRKVTKAVNGGYNGLEDRIDKTYKYYEMQKH